MTNCYVKSGKRSFSSLFEQWLPFIRRRRRCGCRPCCWWLKSWSECWTGKKSIKGKKYHFNILSRRLKSVFLTHRIAPQPIACKPGYFDVRQYIWKSSIYHTDGTADDNTKASIHTFLICGPETPFAINWNMALSFSPAMSNSGIVWQKSRRKDTKNIVQCLSPVNHSLSMCSMTFNSFLFLKKGIPLLYGFNFISLLMQCDT